MAEGQAEIEYWFPVNRIGGVIRRLTRESTVWRRRKCRGCRQTKKDTAKQINRWLPKARSAIQRHAEKYIELGLATSVEDFCVKYGWSVAQLAHDMAFYYKNGCGYCHRGYKLMGHGSADITIDIIWPYRPKGHPDHGDPKRLPYYGTNAKLCCSTCNKGKGDDDPPVWEMKLSLWRQWEKWCIEHPLEPPPEQLGFAI